MPDMTCGGGRYRAERRDENRSPLLKLTKRGLRVNRLQHAEKREDNGQVVWADLYLCGDLCVFRAAFKAVSNFDKNSCATWFFQLGVKSPLFLR